jgi:4-carboxymuconolactone decarboxylase
MTHKVKSDETTATRYERGKAKLCEVGGQEGMEAISGLGDLGRYVIEFAYGDIYSRKRLNLRERMLVTVAILIVLGGRQEELSLHLDSALNVGLTPKEIEEVIIQTVPYAGFPTAINALQLLQERMSAS